MKYCPVSALDCPYYDANEDCCLLDNPEEDCDDYACYNDDIDDDVDESNYDPYSGCDVFENDDMF